MFSLANSTKTFANQTKDFVIAFGDNQEVRKINYKTKVMFYGFNEDNDVVAKNVVINGEQTNP